MPEIRKDTIRDQWVGLAVDKALAPQKFPSVRKKMRLEHSDFCPFCEGNEDATPPEVFAMRAGGGVSNGINWDLRLIPSKFTTFHSDEEFISSDQGINQSYNGFGRHEVLVETPDHDLEMADYDIKRLLNILNIWKRRYNQLASDRRFKYIQIYKNSGFLAGASIDHGHSQIIAYPFIPNNHAGVYKYHRVHKRCLLCDMIFQEIEQAVRILYDNADFLLLMPYAPRFPYETWLVPHRHSQHFGFISAREVQSLARLLRGFLRTLRLVLDNPAFNILIHTAPINTANQEMFHWFIEITPRMLIASGVEIVSGVYMNPVAPEIAAGILRQKLEF